MSRELMAGRLITTMPDGSLLVLSRWYYPADHREREIGFGVGQDS
jgi:hypothetical protein